MRHRGPPYKDPFGFPQTVTVEPELHSEQRVECGRLACPASRDQKGCVVFALGSFEHGAPTGGGPYGRVFALTEIVIGCGSDEDVRVCDARGRLGDRTGAALVIPARDLLRKVKIASDRVHERVMYQLIEDRDKL